MIPDLNVGAVEAAQEGSLREVLRKVCVAVSHDLVQRRQVICHVALVHMDRDQRLDLASVHLRAEVLQAP